MQFNTKLGIDPEIMEKLSVGEGKLWCAAHADGSDNRIDGEAILEASTFGADIGLLEAGVQWIRKLFRNRGKTREDLAAEKEAAGINLTCGSLEQMLLDYFRAAKKGPSTRSPSRNCSGPWRKCRAMHRPES